MSNRFTPILTLLAAATVLTAARATTDPAALIESMRAMDAAAKELGMKFELVVYPDGQHGFNVEGPGYRGDYATDAWRRTVEALRAQHPPKSQ